MAFKKSHQDNGRLQPKSRVWDRSKKFWGWADMARKSSGPISLIQAGLIGLSPDWAEFCRL